MKYTIETNVSGNWEVFEDWREYNNIEVAETALWVLVRDLKQLFPDLQEKYFRVAEKTS